VALSPQEARKELTENLTSDWEEIKEEEPESISTLESVTYTEQTPAKIEAEAVPLSKPELEQISDALAMTQDESMARVLQLAAFKESVIGDLAPD